MCIYTAYYMIVILFSYTTIQLKYIHKQQQQQLLLLLLLQHHQQIAATSTRTTKKQQQQHQQPHKHTDLCTKNVINMKLY